MYQIKLLYKKWLLGPFIEIADGAFWSQSDTELGNIVVCKIVFFMQSSFCIFYHTSLYRIFLVLPSGSSITGLSGELTHEQSTYNLPWEKQSFLKSTPATFKDGTCALLIIVMARHTLKTVTVMN